MALQGFYSNQGKCLALGTQYRNETPPGIRREKRISSANQRAAELLQNLPSWGKMERALDTRPSFALGPLQGTDKACCMRL